MSKRKRAPSAAGSTRPRAAQPGARPAASVVWFAWLAAPELWRLTWLSGLTALLVATPLFPSESAADGQGVTLLTLWWLLALGWSASCLFTRPARARFDGVSLALGVFLLLHSASALYVVLSGVGEGRPALNMAWTWLALGLAFFLTRQLVARPGEIRALVMVLAALALCVALYGYYDYFVTRPGMWRAYQRASAERQAAMRAEAGVFGPEGSPEVSQFENRLQDREPLATFGLTNSLAGFLTPWLVALGGVALAAWSNRARPGGPSTAALVGALAAAAAVLGCLVLTKSRTAYLALAVGAALLLVHARARGWRLGWRVPTALAATAAALAVAAALTKGLDVAVLSEAPKSLLYRLEYWQASAAMIRDHPLLGCGPGNFQSTYTAYKLPQASETIADPHNFLVEIWATAGGPALAAFVALVVACAWRLRALGKNAPVPSDSSPAGGPLGQRNNISDNFQSLVDQAASAPVHPTHESPPAAAHDQRSPNAPRPHAPRQASASRPANAPAGETPDAPTAGWPVYVGAAVGFLLSFPLRGAAGFPLHEMLLIVGLPAAVGLLAACDGWVRRGPLRPGVPLCAAAALLVNLLAAGGIGFPGVAASLWVLAALALNAAERDAPRPIPRWAAYAVLLGALTLAVLFHRGVNAPVLRSPWLADQARPELERGDWTAAEQWLIAAAAADPLDSRPWRELMEIRFLVAEARDDATNRDAWRRAARELLLRAPRAHALWSRVGALYWKAYRHWRRDDDRRQALRHYEQARDLYPASALAHAQLAWVRHVAGDARAADDAAHALRLDERNPHREFKLSNPHVQVFDPLLTEEIAQLPTTDSGPPPATTEQLMRRLLEGRQR